MPTLKDVVTPSATTEHLTGRVKWFNKGYGFLTVTDGVRSGSDIFVHHSSINVENQQYKYLVQGEYVEFDLVKIDSDKCSENREWQASNVSGIRGGKLMCETRHDLKMTRNDYKSSKQSTEHASPVEPNMPCQKIPREAVEPNVFTPIKQRKTPTPRLRGEGPRDGEVGDSKEWNLTTKKGKSDPPKPRGRPPRQTSATFQSK
jgi:cold shock CspA family protein